MLNPARTRGASAGTRASMTAAACSKRRRRLGPRTSPVLSPVTREAEGEAPAATRHELVEQGEQAFLAAVAGPVQQDGGGCRFRPPSSPLSTPLSRSPSCAYVKEESRLRPTFIHGVLMAHLLIRMWVWRPYEQSGMGTMILPATTVLVVLSRAA